MAEEMTLEQQQAIALANARMRAAQAQPQQMGYAEDITRSLPAGFNRGIAGIAGLPGDLMRMSHQGGQFVERKLRGETPEQYSARQQRGESYLSASSETPITLPGSQQTTQAMESVLGPQHKPQTMPGRYAHTVGEYAPGAFGPGSAARNIVGGVLIPAATAQTAHELAPEPYKDIAKMAGGVAGGFIGSLPVPKLGARARADQVIIDALTPDAQTKLNKLGPQAFLFEGNPTTTQVAQGVAQRPGPASETLRKAVTNRHEAAPVRLNQDVRSNFGPPVAPQRVDVRISNAQKALSPEYQQALKGTGKVDLNPIIKSLDDDIGKLAGAPKKTLEEVRRFFFDEKRLKDTTGELLSIRQAIDDLAPKLSGQNNAERLLTNYRKMVDGTLGKVAPDVKLVDAKFQQLARQRDALQKGGNILAVGKEAVRPSQLTQDMSKMSPQEKVALRLGARGEIDRVMGTSVFDVNALRNTVKSEGKWNHDKLSQIFGKAEADKVIGAVDREVAFRAAYDRLVANSQTAPRLLAEELTRVRGPGNISPEVIGALGSTMVTGSPAAALPVAGAITGLRKTAEAITAGGQRRLDAALSKTLQLQGTARDAEIVRLLTRGNAQQNRLPHGTRAILDAILASGSARAQ